MTRRQWFLELGGGAVLAGWTGVDLSAAELPPGGLTNMLTVNMMMKATATAARVTRGLRCFMAPPPPDG